MVDNPMNLSSLQQQDPLVIEILGTASQTHIYNYDNVLNKWDKTNVGGPMFVYKRSSAPTYSFTVLNIHDDDVFIEPLTYKHEFQLELPFLLYRARNKINGIWFFKPDECQNLTNILLRLMDHITSFPESEGDCDGNKRDDNVDILQILSGAQQRFESKTKGTCEALPIISSESNSKQDLIRPKPLRGIQASDGNANTESGPSHLQRLFEDMKMSNQQFHALGTSESSLLPDVAINSYHSQSVSEVGPSSLSRPGHSGGITVEEVERQQGHKVPQALGVAADPLFQGQTPDSTKELFNRIMAATGSCSAAGCLPTMPSSNGVCPSKLSLCTPVQNAGEKSALLTPNYFHGDGDEAIVNYPDVLMSPTAFTDSESLLLMAPLSSIGSNPVFEDCKVSPLTCQQLQEALIHIIRTDGDFVLKMHQAYLQSFHQQCQRLGSISKR